MQSIDVYSDNMQTAATNLKNALTQYASDYFDSFETDFTDSGGEKIVKCMIGQNAALKIVYKIQTSSYPCFRFGNTSITFGYSERQCNICKIFVMDKAILLVSGGLNSPPSYRYNYPIVLCKKQNGDTAILFLGARSNYYTVAAATTGERFCGIISINRTTGDSDYSNIPMYYSTNSSQLVWGYTPFSTDGVVMADVFAPQNSDFRDHTEPFTYTLNSQTYTAIAGNYFAVKGT